jgi:DNA polymerase elongation subunit (family B)
MAGSRIDELAYKYLLNSAYGKFATDPEKFKKWFLRSIGEDCTYLSYDFEGDLGHLSLWSLPDYKESGFYDVATAASITGWVRAYLWRTIKNCKDVLYCDTDSIICKRHAIKLSDELGDWKLEDKLTEVRIAGKKLYSIYNGKEWKTASKGVRIDEKDMKTIIKGGTVEWENQAPSFKVCNSGATFVKRRIKTRK